MPVVATPQNSRFVLSATKQNLNVGFPTSDGGKMKGIFFRALFAICLVLGLASLIFGQQRFKVWAECNSGCDRPSFPQTIHFQYDRNFHISTSTDYPQNGVFITKNSFQTTTEYTFEENSRNYFVNKSTGRRVDPALNTILLKVYKLGEYCESKNIKGSFSETGRFAALAELRQHLGLAVPVRPRGGVKRMNTNPRKGE
jgi:hypothetical protein